MAQAQADGERLVRADPLAHRQRVILQRIKNFPPSFAAMDVRAIGEVQAVIQFHGRSERQLIHMVKMAEKDFCKAQTALTRQAKV